MADTPLRALLLTIAWGMGDYEMTPVEDDRGANIGEILMARYGYGIVDLMQDYKPHSSLSQEDAEFAKEALMFSSDFLRRLLGIEGFERPGAPS